MTEYRYEDHGSLKYIYDGPIKLTGGHHEYNIERDGSITGRLGDLVETVMTVEGIWIINNGSDKATADKIRRDNSVIHYLNFRKSCEVLGCMRRYDE